jgi:NAD+ kinase
MTKKFGTVGLWGRLSEPSVTELALQVVAHLQKGGIRVVVARHAATPEQLANVERVDDDELGSRVDLLVAIGGDGTLLTAARQVARHDVPLIGVNRGRLGFLTDITPEYMLDAIDAILGGDYLAEQRRLLRASVAREHGHDDSSMLALNDVVLQKGESGRMLDFVTSVDGLYVNTHRGDGLIVATPTGSTAYALSCGGPIIQPNVDSVVMVPICPHTLSDRPLVLKDSSEIEVRVETAGGSPASVVCDGEEFTKIGDEAILRIRRARETVTLLHPRDYNYYELLRSKLNWGRYNHSGRKAPS